MSFTFEPWARALALHCCSTYVQTLPVDLDCRHLCHSLPSSWMSPASYSPLGVSPSPCLSFLSLLPSCQCVPCSLAPLKPSLHPPALGPLVPSAPPPVPPSTPFTILLLAYIPIPSPTPPLFTSFLLQPETLASYISHSLNSILDSLPTALPFF